MYSIDYLVEKFAQAIEDLATGEGDVRSRVKVAFHRFWTIDIESYPEHLRKDRLQITRLLTRLPAPQGRIIPENLRRMKNKTASNIARLILYLYVDLVKARSRHEPRV